MPEYQGKSVTLNKPSRISKGEPGFGRKKFKVYVKKRKLGKMLSSNGFLSILINFQFLLAEPPISKRCYGYWDEIRPVGREYRSWQTTHITWAFSLPELFIFYFKIGN